MMSTSLPDSSSENDGQTCRRSNETRVKKATWKGNRFPVPKRICAKGDDGAHRAADASAPPGSTAGVSGFRTPLLSENRSTLSKCDPFLTADSGSADHPHSVSWIENPVKRL
jgi:hypothetical protein